MKIKKYKFSNKNQSLGGTLSTAMGILSLSLILYCVFISYKAEGKGGIIIGSLALFSMMLAIFGCVIGLISFKEDDKFYFLSKFGSILCGVIAVFMIAVLLMGI